VPSVAPNTLNGNKASRNEIRVGEWDRFIELQAGNGGSK
jgi:hypothetical protein